MAARGRYLVGVFLDDTEPVDPPPERLIFADGSFTELSPGLRQVFFAGDGLTGTGTGVPQVFNVPETATRLFLGFQDRHASTPDLPGWYGDNSGSLSLTVEQTGDASGIEDGSLPTSGFHLLQSYPNPFNPMTTIQYELQKPCLVTLHVYDVTGHLIHILRDAVYEGTGRHEAIWYGKDDFGGSVASGTYFYHLVAGDFVRTEKMVLLK